MLVAPWMIEAGMTESLYRDDSYLRSCQAKAVRTDDGSVILDQTVFYAAGGGQPGDTGTLRFADQEVTVTDTIRDREENQIRHLVTAKVDQGTELIATLDWPRRFLTMRTHTALHLLYAAVKLPVTGGRMTPGRGRLDFDMPDPPDRDAIQARLTELVAANAAVTTRWVDWDYLDANPEMVKTMAIKPPRGTGMVSLVDIADIDIQACGGTHVRTTGEVGEIRLVKVEKKGRINRRIIIEVVDG